MPLNLSDENQNQSLETDSNIYAALTILSIPISLPAEVVMVKVR
jgi:hypothetical protein